MAINLLITLQNPTEMLFPLQSLLHPIRDYKYPLPMLLQDAGCSQACSCAYQAETSAYHRAISVSLPIVT